MSTEHLIPENLLSLAKDSRYVQQCQALVLHVMESLHRGGVPESQLQKDSWFLSLLLYILFVVFPNGGRTMGMDTCGLKFTQLTSRLRVVASLLIPTCGLYGFQRLMDNYDSAGIGTRDHDRTTPNMHRESLRGAERRRVYEALRQQMLRRTETSSPTRTLVTAGEPSLGIVSAQSSRKHFNDRPATLFSRALPYLISSCKVSHALAVTS